MLQDIHKSTGERMRKCISSLQRDFATIRSGRVSVSILDNVKVGYYGTPTVLSQVGSVLAQDANTIVVTPWEKNMLKDIEKALQEANVGANPSSNGDSIKLFFPPMTGDQRKEIAKQVKTMGEKAKVSIRNVRQDSNNAIKRLEKDKAITSDDSKNGIDEIQRITDEHIKKIDSMVKSKEQEVLKV